MTATLEKTGYTYCKRLPLLYEEAVEKATAALQEEGFGVLTEIDVCHTLKKKPDVDFPHYVILGACNPPPLCAEPQIGVLVTCNVVYDDEADGNAPPNGGPA